MEKNVVRGAWWIPAVAMACLAASDARADDTNLYVTFSGGMQPQRVEVTSATGGVTTASRSVNGFSTPSISIPLKITRSNVDSVLLRYAATSLVNPAAYPHLSLKAETFHRIAVNASQLTDTKVYDDVAVTQLDIPGTYGVASAHGDFVITASVVKMTDSPTPGPVGPFPTAHVDGLVQGVPPYWRATLAGLTTATKEPPEGHFKFEKFTLTSTRTTPVPLVLHSSQVTTQDVKSWFATHPGGQATIKWEAGANNSFLVTFKNVTITSVTSDSNNGDGPAPITVHLTGLVDSIVMS